MLNWDGVIPERRYAIFRNCFCQDYMIVVTGNDIKTAEKWGGFVCWVGGVRPAEFRNVNKKSQ